MKITKRQLRRIIKEEKARILQEQVSPFKGRGGEFYDALEDVVMQYAPDGAGYLSAEDFLDLEASVKEAMEELKDRLLDPNASKSGLRSVSIGPPKTP